MLHPGVATAFQDVQKADDVARHIGVRVDRRVAHAGLSGEVDHAQGTVILKKPLYSGGIGDVEMMMAVVRPGLQPREPRPLQGGIIVVVEIVHADDRLAAIE